MVIGTVMVSAGELSALMVACSSEGDFDVLDGRRVLYLG